jgi:diguanylate cyclase (GGDEF)-like protein
MAYTDKSESLIEGTKIRIYFTRGWEMKNKYIIYEICYGCMFFLFAFFVLWTVVRYKGPSISEASFSGVVSYSTNWTLADGGEVNLDKLHKTDGAEAYEEVSVYNTLPASLADGDSLCFRSKNIFFEVYLEGELIYEPYYDESAFYTNSYGTNWHYIELPEDAAGKQIEIRYYRVYTDSRACIDNIYLGDAGAAILKTWTEKMVSYITCILLLFVGILLIIIDIPANMSSTKNHQLRYLGLFSVAVSIWCLSETNLIQFFVGNSRAMQIVSCCSLMLIPIPIVLYMDAGFGLKHKWLVPLVCWFSVTEFVVCWLLHFLKIADIHDTMSFSHCMLALVAIMLLVVIVRNTFFVKNKKGGRDVYRILRGVGLSGISIATIIDIGRYYVGNGSDSALFVRIGLLIFIICFGSSSMEKIISAVKLGAEAEIISQLAYKDGLTKLGNRTAFNEKLEELEEKRSELVNVGIVMLDVNNLKQTNDNLGHHVGDQMIVKSAESILAAFGDLPGDCYRIGGDEFAVILSEGDVDELYKKGTERFEEIVAVYNETEGRAFNLSVAKGYYSYSKNKNKKDTFTQVYEKADALMYENKKAMKRQLAQGTL